LSNLDAKLRQEMRSEIRRICKTAGFTTVYVTHDQKEALSVADRIAVLRAGRLAQVGTPADLYHRPVSGFVAEFIGQTNLLDGRVIAGDAGDRTVRVQTDAGTLLAATDERQTLTAGAAVRLSIRPEQIRIARNGTAGSPGANRLTGRAVETSFLGETSEHVVLVGDRGPRLKLISVPPVLDPPPQLTIEFDPCDVVVLPAGS
jgi:iron(III) transport system ATP-binding protein